MLVVRFFLLFSLQFIIFSSIICAKDIVLVKNGKFVQNYGVKVQSIENGDVLVFEIFGQGTKRFKIYKILAKGRISNTSNQSTFIAVIDNRSQKVLRIPLDVGKFNRDYSYEDFIRKFFEGYNTLISNSNIPVVTLYPQLSYSPFFIVVENLVPAFTLEELITAIKEQPNDSPLNVGLVKINPNKIDFYINKFLEFAKTTFMFSSAEDLKTSDIVWSIKKKKFILADIFDGYTRAEFWDEGNIFFNQELTGHLKKQVNDIISELRKKAQLPKMTQFDNFDCDFLF